MISVEEAQRRILDCVQTLEPEEKPILDCLGQVLATDIYSAVEIAIIRPYYKLIGASSGQ